MSSLSLFRSLLFVQVIILGCYGTNDVPFSFVKDAVAKRAVCMDGTPAGYYHAIGFGGGVNNWILYIMGGGWCNDNSTCQQRRDGPYGSTRSVKPKHFSGILSSNQDINPDFYNWNIVFVYYCDGSSLLGDTDIIDSGANLQSRGSRILDAIVDDLLEKGMKNANNILFSGRSAGGVATILHCDSFRARVPNVDKIKCFSDAGFLIRARNVADADYREQYYNSIINFHNLTNFLPKWCTSRIDSGLCMFPENLVQDIQTPLFLLNSAFDWVQINYFLKPDNSGDLKGWQNCTNNLTMCTPAQRELIKKFRNAFLETLMNIGDNPSRGLFINACYSHVFSESDELWNSNMSPTLGNMTIAQAVGDWFFDRSSVKLIDNQTDFPVNCPV